MTEDGKLMIDLRRMFPEAVKRVEILERLKRSWRLVVKRPILMRRSRPVVLGVNELTIEVVDDETRNTLSNMKGNIIRALEALGYEAAGEFSVKFVDGLKFVDGARHDNKRQPKKPALKAAADEARIAQYMEGAPETLPEDINRALSHLMAYLEAVKRGGK